MVATSVREGVRALPVLEGRWRWVDWVPVDVAAGTVSEILLSHSEEDSGEGEKYSVHNIVNPHPIPWSEMLELLQSALASDGKERLEEVSMKEWVKRLNAVADSSREDVPGVRLLAFFEDMVGDESASKAFETKKSEGVSRSMRECGPVCREWVEKNIKVWRENGFL